MKQFRISVALFVLVVALALLAVATRALAVPALCSITGTIYKPDSTPCANCVITFTPTGTVPQIVGGTPIYPTTVYTTTNASGVMTAISLIQGAAMTVTITDSNGFVSAAVPTSVAMNTGETIAQLLTNNLLASGVVTVSAFSLGTKTITVADSVYTISATDLVVLCDATGGPVTINLPASTGGGRWLEIKKIDPSANACTVTPIGGDTIDGLASYALSFQYAAVDLKDGKLAFWAAMSAYRQQHVGLDLGNNNLTAVNALTGGNTGLVITSPSGDLTVTGSQTDGGDVLNHINWNKIIDPRTYGCHGDMRIDTTAVVTSGSTTVTGAGPWASTDCNIAHGAGCTGSVDKVIRLDDSTDKNEVWAGTIVGFNSVGSIVISSAPTVTNGHAFQATWATADDSCLAAINTAMGDSTALRSARIDFTIPVAITTTWVMRSWTGEVAGSGCSFSGSAVRPGSPFVWFGTTPDVPMIKVKGSYGLNIHNMCLMGGSFYPPSFGIDYDQQGPDLPNILNTLRNSQIGSTVQGVAGDYIPDHGQVFVGTPSGNITANTITLTAMPTTFSGPGPNQLLEIVDTGAGATEGNEVVRTSNAYVRGASPIVLTGNVDHTHTGANTVVLIAQGTVDNGFGMNWQSAQDDKNKFQDNQVRDANTCVALGTLQTVTGITISGMSCNQDLFGIYQQAGAASVIGTEFEGVGVDYIQSHTAQMFVSGDSDQKGSGPSYGPGFGFTQQGGALEYIASTTGGGITSLLTSFTCAQCFIDEASVLNSNGDFANLGYGSTVSLVYTNLRLGREALGTIGNTVQPTIHTYGNGKRYVSASYYMVADPPHHIVIDDPGASDNQSNRVYDLIKMPTSINASPERTKLMLRGTQTSRDVHNEADEGGWTNLLGAFSASTIDLTANILTVTCTGGLGGPNDYWYHYAYSTHGLLQKANTTGTKAACLNAPSIANPVTVTVFGVRGADTLHLYQASCACAGGDCVASPCADPNTEVEVAYIPVNSSPSTGFNVNSVQDTGATTTNPMPAVDDTGRVSAGHFQFLGTPFPTPAATPAGTKELTFLDSAGNEWKVAAYPGPTAMPTPQPTPTASP